MPALDPGSWRPGVAKRSAKGLTTDSRAGHLAETLPMPLSAGRHQFRLQGSMLPGSGQAWIELLAEKGARPLGRRRLEPSESEGGTLAVLEVKLLAGFADVQVRIAVDASVVLTVQNLDVVAFPRWLVLSNCQTIGLANCLGLLAPQADVESCDVWALQQDLPTWLSRLPAYDRLVLSPEARNFGLNHLDDDPRVSWLPGVFFCGFHPDLSYVTVDGVMLKGPLDDYHSVIAVAAYKRGWSLPSTLRAFDRTVYERAGYHGLWAQERSRLFQEFDAAGWDLRPEFLRWVRQGAFMYSVNHPRIWVLSGLARLILQRWGEPVTESLIQPHDNLVNGAVFPVYPELAERLGLPGGSYRFKPPGMYRTLSLQDYLQQCFDVYDEQGRDAIQSMSPFFDRVNQALGDRP